MSEDQKLKTLQMYYAAALADSTLRYDKAGILDEVTAQKRMEQMKNGAALVVRFRVKEPQDTKNSGYIQLRRLGLRKNN